MASGLSQQSWQLRSTESHTTLTHGHKYPLTARCEQGGVRPIDHHVLCPGNIRSDEEGAMSCGEMFDFVDLMKRGVVVWSDVYIDLYWSCTLVT